MSVSQKLLNMIWGTKAELGARRAGGGGCRSHSGEAGLVGTRDMLLHVTM